MNNEVTKITVQTIVNATIERVWKLWTTATEIMQWNIPFSDWHSPRVEIDLRSGGSFLFRMEAKDGSAGFDHKGTYDTVIQNEIIEYTVSDGRTSKIKFVNDGDSTTVIEIFEPEKETPIEVQRDFVQSVLNNFKRYAEGALATSDY